MLKLESLGRGAWGSQIGCLPFQLEQTFSVVLWSDICVRVLNILAFRPLRFAVQLPTARIERPFLKRKVAERPRIHEHREEGFRKFPL